MARPSNKDPLDRFRWSVQIDGFTRMGFASCDVPSYTVNTKKYPEGGAHLWPRQIVDSVDYKPVTLSRGVTSDPSFHDWATQFMELTTSENTREVLQTRVEPDFILGPGDELINRGNITTTESTIQGVPAIEYRRDVFIHHMDRNGNIVKTYTLHNAFPIEYAPASSFAADGDDLLSMEKLTLVYESFSVATKGRDINPFDIRDSFKKLVRRF